MFIRSNTGTANVKKELLRKVDNEYFFNNVYKFIGKFIVIKYYNRYYIIYVDGINRLSNCLVTSIKDLPVIISKKMKGEKYACKLFGLDFPTNRNMSSSSNNSSIEEVWEFKLNEKKTNIRR